MDLPATQAIDDEEFAPTQSHPANDTDPDAIVATLEIDDDSHLIFSGSTSIGRHPECKIVINHETVSKNHAEIEAESAESAIFIKDLGSSNKTRINRSKLRAHAAYQIKDGDELTFGSVVAKFKLCPVVEDSFVSHTPQATRKTLIPGTPDSLMNASSASESDVSAIPGTQADDVNSSFRRPQIPVLPSTSNAQSPQLMRFSSGDLPSPITNDKKKENIEEIETQRYSVGDTREITDNSIYIAQSQEALPVANLVDQEDENIFEMETQRPNSIDDDFENLATQPRSAKKSSIDRRTSQNVSIYSAETQKIGSETPTVSRKSLAEKLIDVSIYSAETQKVVREPDNEVPIEDLVTQKVIPEDPVDELFENLETQSFVDEKPNNFSTPRPLSRKSIKISSISKAQDSKPFEITESLDDAETQRYEDEISNKTVTSNVSKRLSRSSSSHTSQMHKSIPVTETVESIDDAETQAFVNEKADQLEASNASTRMSRGRISSTPLNKKVVPVSTADVPIEDFETQPFENEKGGQFQTPNTPRRMSKRLSNNFQNKVAPVAEVNESIEDVETQKFEVSKTDQFQTPKVPRRESSNRLSSIQNNKVVPMANVEESIEDVETQPFENEKTDKCLTPNVPRRTSTSRLSSIPQVKNASSAVEVDKSIEDAETQAFEEAEVFQTPDEPSCKSSRLSSISQIKKDVSETDQSIEDMETEPFENEKSDVFHTPNAPRRITSGRLSSTLINKELKCVVEVDSSIEDAETQAFDNTNKTPNVSRRVSSSRLSSCTPHVEKNVTAALDKPIEDAETQQFENEKVTKFQTPDIPRRMSSTRSSCISQNKKDDPMVEVDESIEDAETQQFVNEKSLSNTKSFHTPQQRQSIVKIQSNSEAQKSLCVSEANEPIEDAETQVYEVRKSNKFQTPISNQRRSNKANVTTLESSSTSENIEEAETQNFTANISSKVDSSDTVLSTSPLKSRKSIISTPVGLKEINKSVLSESIDDLETQEIVDTKSSTVINESIENIESEISLDESTKLSTNLPETTKNIEETPVKQNKTLTNELVENVEIQKPEFAVDSGVSSTDHDSEKENTSLIKDCSEINKSSSNTSKIANKSIEEPLSADEDDDMFCSQNLLENCPIELMGEEKDENEIEESDKNEVDENISNISTKVHKSADEKPNKNLQIQNLGNPESDETDEEGVFSSFTSKEESNVKTDCKNNESDSETDEEGIFSNLESRKDISNKSSVPDKLNTSVKSSTKKSSDSETDEEGIFSNLESCKDNSNKSSVQDKLNTSVKSSTKKSSDSETDEDGVFSCNLPKENKNSNDMEKLNTSKKSDNKSNESETDEFSLHLSKDDTDKSLNKSMKDNLEINKSEDLQNRSLKETSHSFSKESCEAMSDEDDDMFNDSEEEDGTSAEQPNKTLSDSTSKDDSTTKASSVPIKDSEKSQDKIEEIDDEAPTQLLSSKASESESDTLPIARHSSATDRKRKSEITGNEAPQKICKSEDNFLGPTQLIHRRKTEACIQEVDDLEPTQKIDTQSSQSRRAKSTGFISASNVIDFELAPTQKMPETELEPTQLLETEKTQVIGADAEDDHVATTQLLSRKKIIGGESTQEQLDFELAPTQKMDNTEALELAPTQKMDDTEALELAPTQKMDDTEALEPTQIVDTKNVTDKTSIKSLRDKVLSSPIISKAEARISLNLSKRQLEEVEITSNKKRKSTNQSSSTKVDFDSTIEKHLNILFEGAEEKQPDKEPELLTQQLENILESSQVEDVSNINVSTLAPSPTLSSRRTQFKSNNRRKTQNKLSSSFPTLSEKDPKQNELRRHASDLNDTIEKNLKDLFNDSASPSALESCENDVMMTQQLKDILSSQEDDRTIEESITSKMKSPNISVNSDNKQRLSLHTPSRGHRVAEQKTRSSLGHSIKKKSRRIESSSNDESQETEDYFANLRSKRKSVMVMESQETEENSSTASQSSESDREIRRDTIGFSSDLVPVCTPSSRGKLLAAKTRSFSMHIPSDNEEALERSASGSSQGSSKRRFKLSLSKHVDLNSSMSSLVGDQEVESKVSASLSRKSQSSEKSALPSTPSRRTPSSRVSEKRVLARGTRGFSSSLQPVESEELVSAASTASSEQDSPTKQVCNQSASNVRTSACKDEDEFVPSSQISRAAGDDDDDFLKNMPEIKVAGTADCPPTASQLAAESDDDDLHSVSSTEVSVPKKWNWYAHKRYDLIYTKKAKIGKEKDIEEEEEEEEVEKSKSEATVTVKTPSVKKPSIDDILAQLKSPMSEPKRRSKRTSDLQDGQVTRSRSLRSLGTRQSSALDSSPHASIKSASPSVSVTSRVAEGSESDSDALSSILPKYKPLDPSRLQDRLAALADDDESDQEFQELRQKCSRMLAAQAENASLRGRQVASGQRPSRARRNVRTTTTPTTRRETESASNRAGNASTKRTRRDTSASKKPATADKDGLMFQVLSAAVTSSTRTPTTKTTPTNSTSRGNRTSKRGPKHGLEADQEVDHAADHAVAHEDENRPPKASKRSANASIKSKFQQVSVLLSPLRENVLINNGRLLKREDDNVKMLVEQLDSSTDTSVQHKRANKEAMVLKESYILVEKSKSPTRLPSESSDGSEAKASIKSSSNVGLSLRGRKDNTTKQAREASTVKQRNNSSKENITVVELDEKSVAIPQEPRNAVGKTRNKVPATQLKEKASSNLVDYGVSKRTRRGGVTQVGSSLNVFDKSNQENKRRLRTDSESTESEFVSSQETKNETVTSEASPVSNNSSTKNTTNKKTRYNRICNVKDTDTEKSDSEVSIKNKNVKNVRTISTSQNKLVDVKGTKSKQVESITDLDTENESLTSVGSRITRNRRAQNSSATQSDSSTVDVSSRRIKRGRAQIHESLQDDKSEISSVNTARNLKNTRSRNAINSSEDSEYSISKRVTRGKQLKLVDKYSSAVSALLASSEDENVVSEEVKKDNSRPKRQTRKRPASPDVLDSKIEKPNTRAKLSRACKNSALQLTASLALNEESDLASSVSVSSSVRRKSPSPSLTSDLSESERSPPIWKNIMLLGEKADSFRKVIEKLDGSETKSLKYCSVLVTDKVQKSSEFLCLLARGIPIVSFNWLRDSNIAQRFLNIDGYILKDSVAEAKHNFTLKSSLQRAQEEKLLDGYTILLAPHSQPSTAELKEMVILSGGKALVRAPVKWPSNIVVIANEEDLEKAQKLIKKAPKSVTVHSTDFLLIGIMRQKLNFEKFKLHI